MLALAAEVRAEFAHGVNGGDGVGVLFHFNSLDILEINIVCVLWVWFG